VGISLNPDGSEDHLLSIRDLPNITIREWRLLQEPDDDTIIVKAPQEDLNFQNPTAPFTIELRRRRALNRTTNNTLVRESEVDNRDIKEDKGSDATTNTGDDIADCFDLTDKEDFDPEFSLQDVHNIDIRA
jgi:hypothetical protein